MHKLFGILNITPDVPLDVLKFELFQLECDAVGICQNVG